MALPKDTRERVKAAFINDGMPIAVLAATFGIDATTINRWKKADLKNGDNWERSQAAVLLSGDNLETTAREAFALLACKIKASIEGVSGNEQISDPEQVQLIASLVDSLYKATTANRRIMPQANKLATASETMRHFVKFVQEQFPDKAAHLIEPLEAFGAYLPRVFKE